MAADQHEALIRAYIDEVFNGHRLDGLEKYWDDELTSNWLGMETIASKSPWNASPRAKYNDFADTSDVNLSRSMNRHSGTFTLEGGRNSGWDW